MFFRIFSRLCGQVGCYLIKKGGFTLYKKQLTKAEFELANNALESILDEPVEDIDLTDTLPPKTDLTDSNKVFKGKLSILFVDMRKSTDLTDELKSKKMVKVYRAFIRIIIQAIRYSGGYTRQFAGDGIMGVFQDSIEDEKTTSSSQKATTAARYIHTLVDYCLNPALKKRFDDVCIACGIGICTGTIMITKVGMRGKEANEADENETGIVWVGSTTNYANRYCSLAKPREIFIDESTYKGIEEKNIWNKTNRTKGSKIFYGYTAIDYYLALPEEITQDPVIAEEETIHETSFIQSIFEEAQERALQLVDEISKKSAELAITLENTKKRESQLSILENNATKENERLQQWHLHLESKQAEFNKQEEESKVRLYELYLSIFSKVYCKNEVIKACGKEYWLDLIETMYALGSNIRKSRLQIQIELDCYLVNIYMNFGLYEEAYEALCIQAEHSSWLSIYVLEDVVKKSGHWVKLKGILEKRVNEKKDYSDALQKLKLMGY